MILDLHTHSIKSDDGRAKVENYCQWIRSKEMPLDGFVLTEHRQHDFESDYSRLAEKHGLVILKGSEVETEYGHVLVFGVTEPLTRAFDFSSINLSLESVIETSEAHGAVAVRSADTEFYAPVDAVFGEGLGDLSIETWIHGSAY